MSTTPSPPIAATPEEFTAAWLTEALRAGGLEGTVSGVRDIVPVGTGQMASCYRITLDADAGMPQSVVAKVPAPGANEMSASGYRNELAFYRLLAPHVAARIPRCHYGAIDDSGLPFVLLLEDLAPAVQGDQIAGCTADEARVAVTNLADAHGPLWGHDALATFDASAPSDPSLLVQYMGWGTGEFIARYEPRLTTRQIELLQGFCAVVGGFKANQPADRSVQHGDYRLDNLLFRTEGGAPTCAVVDWQTACVGAPVHDLAYFVTTGLPVESRREHERALVDAYGQQLSAHGVALPAEQLWRDYRFGQGHGVIITVLGAVVAERTARGDEMFMAMIERVCAAIDDLDSLELYR